MHLEVSSLGAVEVGCEFGCIQRGRHNHQPQAVLSLFLKKDVKPVSRSLIYYSGNSMSMMTIDGQLDAATYSWVMLSWHALDITLLHVEVMICSPRSAY